MRPIRKAVLGEHPLRLRLDARERPREGIHRLLLALAGSGNGHEIVDDGVPDLVFDRLIGGGIGVGSHMHAQISRLRPVRLRRERRRHDYYE